MNVFPAALHRFCSHVEVRDHILLLSQGHPFTRVEIDLRQVSAHKFPGPGTLRLRLLRGQWESYSLEGFRPFEIDGLIELLERWERMNHRQPDGDP